MDNIHRLSADLGASRSFLSQMRAQQCDPRTSTNYKYWRAAEYALQHSTLSSGLRGMAPSSRESPPRIRSSENRDDLVSGSAYAHGGPPLNWQLTSEHGKLGSSTTASFTTSKDQLDTMIHAGQLQRQTASWSRPVALISSTSGRDSEYAKHWYESKRAASKRYKGMIPGSVARENVHFNYHLPKLDPILLSRSRYPSSRLTVTEVEVLNPSHPVARLKRGFEEEFTTQALERREPKSISFATTDKSKCTKMNELIPTNPSSLLDMLCSTTLELGPIQDNPAGCSCPRSNCIKLYCDCFKAGRRCSGSCSCVSCKNTLAETRPDGERILAIKNTLARNPRAFTGGKKETGPRNPGAIVCNCVKSRCLKLYCDCFHTGQFCDDACDCNSCFNTKEESGIGGKRHLAIQRCLEKRPDAFTKKVKDAGSGCACKNNRCLKKYCECFRMDLVCTSNCTCKGCENAGVARLVAI